MPMQKHPMATVKETASVLGIDERSVREKLANGQIKGEKRLVGLKEKWFIYRGEVESYQAKHRLPRYEQFGADTFVSETDTFDASPTVDAETVQVEHADSPPPAEDTSWRENQRENIKMLAEELVKPLVETIKAQTTALMEKDRLIADQSSRLLLLPDIQKKLKEEEEQTNLATQKAQALEKQIAALQSELEVLKKKPSFWAWFIGKKS